MIDIDELDRLHAAADPDHKWEWWPGYGISPEDGMTISFGDFIDGDDSDDDAPVHPIAAEVIAMHNAWPAISRELRALRALHDFMESDVYDLVDELMGYAMNGWSWKYGEHWTSKRAALSAVLSAAKAARGTTDA